MLEFNFLGFPVRIQFWFWLTCFIFGGGLSMEGAAGWIPVFEWTLVIFVSVMIHELGHALTVKGFGGYAGIELQAMGGMTYIGGAVFSRAQGILISFAGPACNLFLGSACLAAQLVLPHFSPVADELFEMGKWVNLVWGVFNLLPVMPMDGGQILRDALGPARFGLTCRIGGVTAVLLAILSFKSGFLLAPILLGYFAYLNFRGAVSCGGVRRG